MASAASSLSEGGTSYISTGVPKRRNAMESSAAPTSSDTHHGKPNPAGSVPSSKATMPTDIAYGNCVRTWSIWSQPDAIEERIVVSEMGEQ